MEKTDQLPPVSDHCKKRESMADYERVNYEPREKLCSPGCALGEKLKVRTYEFLKEPLIRKYGQEFYDALEKAAKEYYHATTK